MSCAEPSGGRKVEQKASAEEDDTEDDTKCAKRATNTRWKAHIASLPMEARSFYSGFHLHSMRRKMRSLMHRFRLVCSGITDLTDTSFHRQLDLKLVADEQVDRINSLISTVIALFPKAQYPHAFIKSSKCLL
jgi:hypothetical protein